MAGSPNAGHSEGLDLLRACWAASQRLTGSAGWSPWPSQPPKPQLQTAPSGVRARLCSSPAETATTPWPVKLPSQGLDLPSAAGQQRWPVLLLVAVPVGWQPSFPVLSTVDRALRPLQLFGLIPPSRIYGGTYQLQSIISSDTHRAKQKKETERRVIEPWHQPGS